MKSFFEFLGFVSTALISGFLVFSYVGHKKNTDKPASDELVTAYNKNGVATLPEMAPVSSSRKSASKEKKTSAKGSPAEYPVSRYVAQAPSEAVTEKLKGLFEDESFVRAAVSKWKKQVANASEAYSVKPQLLLSNAIVKSYLGAYSSGDFNRDVSEHAGDLALPTSTAAKSYDYAWSVAKIAQQYDLAKYFPAATPTVSAKVSTSLKSSPVAGKKTAAVVQEKAKPAASTSPAEGGFREMVAKEEGFSSWQGLQRLGDPDTKKRAEKRVKMLLSAARVR